MALTVPCIVKFELVRAVSNASITEMVAYLRVRFYSAVKIVASCDLQTRALTRPKDRFVAAKSAGSVFQQIYN